jgi:predicted nucleotidyltransferase
MSDMDIRGVFVVPTSEILSLGYKEKSTSWIEGEKEDQTAVEYTQATFVPEAKA